MVLPTVVRCMSKRVPSIKFRAGQPAVTSHQPAASQPQVSSPSSGSRAASSGQVIEDWQLPPRYRRKPLDEKEIEAVNSGVSLF